MTSTPPGNRASSCSSARGRSAVELVCGHLLLLLEPVRVSVVLDLRLLRVVESARGILLEDLVPGSDAAIAVLARAQANVQREDLVLEVGLGQHAVRVPAKLAAVLLRRAVLGELLRDLGEIRSRVERLLDVRDLLELIGVGLEVAPRGRERRRDLDPGDAHLVRGRLRVPLLRALRVLLA